MTFNDYLDDRQLRELIAECESSLLKAPASLAAAVMRGIEEKTVTTVTVVPMLSRKLCAAVCFCSAAAIILFTAFGIDRQVTDFILSGPDKLGEIFSAIKIFN